MTVTSHAAHVGCPARHKADQLARQARIEGLVRGWPTWSKATGTAPVC
jgi:hypothetical protein